MKLSFAKILCILSVALAAVSSTHATDLLAIDINHGTSPTEAGFTGQNASGVVHSTTAGDITVSFTGQQGTFDRGASGGTNNGLYRDFIFENNTGSSPDITLTLIGPGIEKGSGRDLLHHGLTYPDGDVTEEHAKTSQSGV